MHYVLEYVGTMRSPMARVLSLPMHSCFYATSRLTFSSKPQVQYMHGGFVAIKAK